MKREEQKQALVNLFLSSMMGIGQVIDEAYNIADSIPNWIPVEERKPPIAYHDDLSENYLVVDSDGELLIAYYDAKNKLWFSVDSNPKIYDVTHWMPLPTPPEKGGGT